MADKDDAWLAEAVIDFLRGPLYINPLMGFIDQKCLIFTPDEENKFEYTTAHEEFKALVDELLTEFLDELGVTPERFYNAMARAQEDDKLSSFVVQTILTVDDFLMFKAMMVKRNMDLTNQVLEAVEAAAARVEGASAPLGSPGSALPGAVRGLVAEDDKATLEAAMRMSAEVAGEMEARTRLHDTMRALQIEDEDTAYASAIAASLKDQNLMDRELADLNQAIALSLALEEERRRMAAAAAAAAAAASSQASTSSPAAAPAAAAVKQQVQPLAPVKVPAVPAAAAMPAAGSPSSASLAGPLPPVQAPIVHEQPAAASGSTVGPLAPVRVPDPPKAPYVPSTTTAASSSRFVPAPINAPTSAKVDLPGPSLAPSGSVRNRAAGFKSDGGGVGPGGTTSSADLTAIRDAARQAADSQKKLLGPGVADKATAWLQDAKLKLIAQKQEERNAETQAYKAARKAVQPAAAPISADDAKRAALREQLAANMKQAMIQKAEQAQS